MLILILFIILLVFNVVFKKIRDAFFWCGYLGWLLFLAALYLNVIAFGIKASLSK